MIKGAQRAQGKGGEGVIWISSDSDDWMGPNIKSQKTPYGFQQTPKNPWTKIEPQKNPLKSPERKTSLAEL